MRFRFWELDFLNEKQYKYTVKNKNISGYCYVKNEELYGGRFNTNSDRKLLTTILTSKDLQNTIFEEITGENKWDIMTGDDYFYRNSLGIVVLENNSDWIVDRRRIATGNACKDEEYMKKLTFKLNLSTKESKFADIHNDRKLDWTDGNQPKFSLEYDACNDEVYITSSYLGHDTNTIYYSSEEVAILAKEEFEKDIIKLATWDIDK